MKAYIQKHRGEFAPAPPQNLRMPVRMVEDVYGAGNFDDAADDMVAMVRGMSPQYDQCIAFDMDSSHPNPWFHAMVCLCDGLPAPAFVQLRCMLKIKGLLEPL